MLIQQAAYFHKRRNQGNKSIEKIQSVLDKILINAVEDMLILMAKNFLLPPLIH